MRAPDYSGTIFMLIGLVLLLASPAAWSESTIDSNCDNALKGVNYMNGFNDESLYRSPYVGSDLGLLQADGVSWARIELPVMSDCNQITPCIASMSQHKIRPLLNLLCDRYNAADQNSRAKYKAWLKATLDTLKNSVQVYEVGNEENLSYAEEGAWGPYGWVGLPDNKLQQQYIYGNDLGPCPSAGPPKEYEICARDYVALLQDSYEVLHGHALVLIGGLSDWHCACYLDMLTKLKAYNYADAIAFHPYGDIPQHGAYFLNWPFAAIRSWPRHLPLWVTEYGYFTSPDPNAGGVANEAIKAKYIAQQYEIMRTNYRIATPIFLYTARDTGYGQAGYVQFGLFERNAPKPFELLPSYAAYKNPMRGHSN